MKKTNCIIIGLTVFTALLTLVGCSTNTNTNTEMTTTRLKPSKPGMSALTSGPDASGGFSETGGSVSCVGTFTGLAYITNSDTGTVWFTPPAGTTNCIATDSSGIPSPYESVVKVTRKDLLSWCGTNSVSFPALSTKQYKFTVYIKNTLPPPTNGAVLTLDVQWQQ
jgi:hypothetical protein